VRFSEENRNRGKKERVLENFFSIFFCWKLREEESCCCTEMNEPEREKSFSFCRETVKKMCQ
jgi:hypothetical protein